MHAVATLNGELPEEERQEVGADEAYHRFLARLSHQSVVKHYDAYADIPWDDPAYAVDAEDPRFELPDLDRWARNTSSARSSSRASCAGSWACSTSAGRRSGSACASTRRRALRSDDERTEARGLSQPG